VRCFFYGFAHHVKPAYRVLMGLEFDSTHRNKLRHCHSIYAQDGVVIGFYACKPDVFERLRW
jgi:hypothetical protein